MLLLLAGSQSFTFCHNAENRASNNNQNKITTSSTNTPDSNSSITYFEIRSKVYGILLGTILIFFIIGLLFYRKYKYSLSNSRTAIREHTRVAGHYKALTDELNQRVEELQSKLIEAEIKVDHAEKLKAAFLANMSHEIRTPLTAILGFSDLMHRSFNSEQKRKFYMGMISKNSKTLLGLIDDILDLSKIEIGEFQLDFIGRGSTNNSASNYGNIKTIVVLQSR